jgi:hypothetical protein
MTSPINNQAYKALNAVFEKFQKEEDKNRTVQDVVVTKIHQIKETFHADFESDFKAVEFFKNKKISDLSDNEKSTIHDIFSRLLRVSESTTLTRVSINDFKALSLVEQPLRVSKLSIESVKKDGLRYEEKMRNYLNLPWSEGRVRLELIDSPVVNTRRQVSFMPDLLNLLEEDMNSTISIEGLVVPNLFVADHLGTRKNTQMELSFSTEQTNHTISTTEEAVEYITAAERFVEEISDEETTDGMKIALRNAILIYSSQQTTNGLASGYTGNQSMIRAELGIDNFSGEPVSSQYRFEPVFDQGGEIIPNQFKVTAYLHMATFRTIRTEEVQLDRAAFQRASMFVQARNHLGIGEVIGAEINGSFIVSMNQDQKMVTSNVKMSCDLVTPLVTDVSRAEKVIEEILDKPGKKVIKEDAKLCEGFIRKQLQFPPGATKRKLPNLSGIITSEMFLPNNKESIEKTVAFAQRVVGAPYTNEINRILGSINKGDFKTYLADTESTILPIREEEFKVTIQSIYLTEKKIEIDPQKGDQQRVDDAQKILGLGRVAKGEVNASFIIKAKDGETVAIRDLRSDYVVTVGGAEDEFVLPEDEFSQAEDLIEDVLKYDQTIQGKFKPLTIDEIKNTSDRYKRALQRELQLSPHVTKTLKLSSNSPALAPSEELEGLAAENFFQDFEGARKSIYRKFSFPGKSSFQMKTDEDVRLFKENIGKFADQIGTSYETKNRIGNALLLFSTQHTENTICGPYIGAILEAIINVQGTFDLRTDMTNADFYFEPSSKKDQFKVTLKAHSATWVRIEMDPERTDEATFIEARNLFGIGEVLGGNIEASFTVKIPKEGPIVVSDVNTSYSIRSG